MSDTKEPLILLVDDDSMMRFLARETLEPRGFRIAEAADGLLGLAQAARLRPDIILLDVMMPNLDGFAVCSQLRALPYGRHTPILMMTGLDDTVSIQQAYKVGATDFITKPLHFELLEFRLHYMLRAKAVGDELRDNETLLATAQRIARLGHWEFEAGKGFTRWSPQTDAVLGLTPGKRMLQVEDLIGRVIESDRPAVYDTFRHSNPALASEAIEYQLVDTAGEIRNIRQHVHQQIDDSGTARLFGTVQDVTDRRRAEQEIQDLAYFDRITGLPNRVLLEKRLAEMLGVAANANHNLAVLTVNLDHFRRVNDHFGHSIGNELLQAFTRRLCSKLRDSVMQSKSLDDISKQQDLIARLAGDQFCVVLGKCHTRRDAEGIARRIREGLRQPFVVAGKELIVTASIGIALAPADGAATEILLHHADLALDHAKRHGRDRTEFYDASMHTRAELRLTIETNLRQALGTSQLALHYQPKMDAQSGQVAGMEALIRWTHPTLGRITPAEFIPIAEQTGLIVPLGDWILREACSQVVTWRAQGLTNLICAVNLSAAQFRERNLPQRVQQILVATGLEPQYLQLEITESMVMRDEHITLSMLRELKQIGLSIAIDDFGTGYSSLSYLKRLPIDVLKIDQSFVRELGEDSDDAAIVLAVIAMAHSLRLKVVAEGVEQKHQLDFLRRHHCDECQGYLFSPALPATEFAGWVKRRREPQLEVV